MRTKALLVTAAVSAAGIASLFAQGGPVYSVNVVGFVNVDLVKDWNMIANPLNGTNNSINTILPSVPDFTYVLKFDAANQVYFQPSTFIGGAWDVEMNLAPGEGAFLWTPEATKVTFVGEVPQGTLSNPIAKNYQLQASQVPRSGGLTADLGFVGKDFDVVYQWDPAAQSYKQPFTFIGGAWDPGDPSLKIAESFFLVRTPDAWTPTDAWTVTFNVQ